MTTIAGTGYGSSASCGDDPAASVGKAAANSSAFPSCGAWGYFGSAYGIVAGADLLEVWVADMAAYAIRKVAVMPPSVPASFADAPDFASLSAPATFNMRVTFQDAPYLSPVAASALASSALSASLLNVTVLRSDGTSVSSGCTGSPYGASYHATCPVTLTNASLTYSARVYYSGIPVGPAAVALAVTSAPVTAPDASKFVVNGFPGNYTVAVGSNFSVAVALYDSHYTRFMANDLAKTATGIGGLSLPIYALLGVDMRSAATGAVVGTNASCAVGNASYVTCAFTMPTVAGSYVANLTFNGSGSVAGNPHPIVVAYPAPPVMPPPPPSPPPPSPPASAGSGDAAAMLAISNAWYVGLGGATFHFRAR